MRVQPVYDHCFVCGPTNPIGLRVTFTDDGRRVRAEFVPGESHQGYPGYLHGGVLYALLDETIGRSAFLADTWVMTGRMEVRYLAPVPIGSRVVAIGEQVRVSRRALELRGEARLDDGTLVAEARGIFVKIPEDVRRQLETVVHDPKPMSDRP